MGEVVEMLDKRLEQRGIAKCDIPRVKQLMATSANLWEFEERLLHERLQALLNDPDGGMEEYRDFVFQLSRTLVGRYPTNGWYWRIK